MVVREIDPTQPPSPPSRRLFVGAAAAATVTAAAISAQARQSPQRADQPPVAEDDPGITVEHVSLASAGGTVPAYAAWPISAGAATPSVVVIMHLWGVDTSIREFVRRLGKAGFAAIAPDLYARFGAPSGDGASDYTTFVPYAKRLDREVWLGDVRVAQAWLASKFPGTKTALTGFCMGGKLALIAAEQTGKLFTVVAPFYGAVEDVDPNAIAIPLCGSYGARDTGIPADGVRAFAHALHVPNDVKIYDEAGHAFMDDQRPSYVAAAAQDAWRRLVACFHEYLAA